MISPSTIISTPHQPSLLRPPQLIIPKRADPSTLPTAPKEKPAAPSRLKTQPSFSRALLLADDPLTPLSAVRGKDDEGEEDVILANVEELLDGWEWDEADAERAEGGKGGMEKRLGAELLALEAVRPFRSSTPSLFAARCLTFYFRVVGSVYVLRRVFIR